MEEEQYEKSLSDIIVNYGLPRNSMANLRIYQDGGIMEIYANHSIIIPAKGYLVCSTGIKMLHGDLYYSKIHHDNFTYHFINNTKRKIELDQFLDKPFKDDVLNNRIHIDSEILLKVYNDTEDDCQIKKYTGLGVIYTVLRIHKISPKYPEPQPQPAATPTPPSIFSEDDDNTKQVHAIMNK